MAKLTAAEKKWIDKVQKVLNEQPKNSRVAFYTIGDNNLVAFNKDQMDEISDYQDTGCYDFGPSALAVDAAFGESLVFSNAVESTAG
jgi:hypothetical protein